MCVIVSAVLLRAVNEYEKCERQLKIARHQRDSVWLAYNNDSTEWIPGEDTDSIDSGPYEFGERGCGCGAVIDQTTGKIKSVIYNNQTFVPEALNDSLRNALDEMKRKDTSLRVVSTSKDECEKLKTVTGVTQDSWVGCGQGYSATIIYDKGERMYQIKAFIHKERSGTESKNHNGHTYWVSDITDSLLAKHKALADSIYLHREL